jgi:hypothetical protein
MLLRIFYQVAAWEVSAFFGNPVAIPSKVSLQVALFNSFESNASFI